MPVPASPLPYQKPGELPVRIAGTGKYLPARIVTAKEVDGLTGKPPGWTMRHTGVSKRHFVEDETSAFLGATALQNALADAGGGRPDLLISASGTPQQPIPCSAAFIAREMGWSGLPCFDINATCLGFIPALETAALLIASGKHERIAIVCAEIASRGLNWEQAEAAALMGDGAAAVILTRVAEDSTDSPALLAAAMETWPEGAALTEIRGGGTSLPAVLHEAGKNSADFLFHMDGPGVFRLAAERIGPFVAGLIGETADRWDSIDLVIPHQGSLLAMRHLRHRLGIPEEKLIEIAADHGNLIAASLPLALHEAIRSGRLLRGQTAMFLGTSAGFSLGGALLRY
jgi:3-oxoacyl-[acyl-carrier-protein] synthase III